MKRSKLLSLSVICFMAWAFCHLSLAETISFDTPEGELKLEVKVSPAPIFPPSLNQDGITEGQVSVLVVVGETGELIDWLVIKASHALLAKSVDRVIEKWDFEPPTLNGEYVAAVNRIDLEFESSGSLIEFSSASASVNAFLSKAVWRINEYGVASVKDLDSIPEPIYVERPLFSIELLRDRSEMRAILDFYIDQEGNVRIPTVRAADDGIDERLLIAAQDALWQWKFNPPTIRGKPVVARAAQPFVFRAMTLGGVFE